MFVGRIEELKRLTEVIQSPKQENVVIYGRRRIGKSELIKHAIGQCGLPYLYYQAKETSEADNVESLSKLVADQFDLGGATFSSMEAVLAFLFDRSATPFVFVIDEYPYLRLLSDGLDSVLQNQIDQKKHSKLKLVLLGSFIDVMKDVLESSRPLYGRITLSLFLSELHYQEAAAFYPDVSNETKLQYYAVFGGVPYYNQLIDPTRSFEDNVCRLIIDDRGTLNDFVELFLSKELRKIQNANAVLETIATGKRRFGDMLDKLQPMFSSAQLAIVLENLMRMDLIQKTTPINEPKTSKKTYYEIKDNFVRFHYRYVFKHSSKRSVLDPKTFYELFVEKDFHTLYVPFVFERIAMDYLVTQNKKGAIRPPFLDIGKLWYDNPKTRTNGEFDVVALRQDGYVVYEAKYTSAPVTDAVVEEEVRQLSDCRVEYVQLGFFSKSGFALSYPQKYDLITLNDLYAAKTMHSTHLQKGQS